MKIEHLLLSCFLFLTVFTSAQTIIVSEDIVLRSDVAYELIGELGGRLLLFRDQTTTFEVQAFDENLRKTWKKELELDKRQPQPLAITYSNKDFTLLYRFRSGGNTCLKAHKYDPGANLIDSVTVKNFGFLFYTPNFETVLSEDRTKMLVYYLERQSIFHTLVFDLTSMQLLWEKSFEPKDFNYWENFQQVLVDDQGSMHLVFSKNNFSTRRDVHYYEVHEYFGEGEIYSSNFSLDGNLTYDVLFTFDNLNNRLVGGGLYSEKNNGRANGHFYLSIRPGSSDDYQLTFQSFEDDFLTALLGKEVSNNKGLDELQVQEVVLRRDGGALLIAERARQNERRMAGVNRVFYDGRSGLIVDYYYDEICLISIHPDGKTHWKSILHKKQYSQDDQGAYSSYFLFKSPTALRFLFNDEIRYENTVSEYVVNSIGRHERNSLLSTANLKLRLRFRDALQIRANELVVPSERRNRLRLVKLQY